MTPAKKDQPSVAEQVANIVPVEPVGADVVSATDTTPVPVDQAEILPTLPPEVQEAAATGNLNPEIARAMSEMQKTITNLEQRLTKSETDRGGSEEGEGGAGGYPWQYYLKRDFGPEANWVVTGPGGGAKGGKRDAGSYSQYVSRGHRPLMNYGVAPVPSDAPKPGQEFWTMIEKGGAKEFPASQVLAFKWHQEPPVAGITFPQYEEVKELVKDFLCDECDLELSFLPDDELAPRACFNHLRNTHDYPRGEAKAAMDSQGIKNVAPFAIRREARELTDERLKVANQG